ncbi:hypothetical protein HDV03_001627 [Kappamyces sp. JEL0829]|nr:hypothetical protein HDV03_001627 [Kappamyces sp. JEL0829]
MDVEDIVCWDWEATKSIYFDFQAMPLARQPSGFQATIELRPSTANTVFIHSAAGTALLYPEPKLPAFIARFSYDGEGLFVGASVVLETPEKKLLQWLARINAHCSTLGDSPGVCDFILSEAVRLFEHQRSYRSKTEDIPIWVVDIGHLDCFSDQRFYQVDTRLGLLPTEDTVDELYDAAIRYIVETSVFDCPICFDRIPYSDGYVLDCGHYSCSSCIQTYCSSQMKSLWELPGKWPFACYIVACRARIADSFLEPFLSATEQTYFTDWWENKLWKGKHLGLPSIAMCPRQKCHGTNMVRVKCTSPLVYCQDCEWTWCERCLGKVQDGHPMCDESRVLLMCSAYSTKSDPERAKLQALHPWLGPYLAWKAADDSAVWEWCRQYASICPSCGIGVEKTDGCHHIHCVCGAHFCYSCHEEFNSRTVYTHACPANPFQEFDDL